jgi:hypothetical protein
MNFNGSKDELVAVVLKELTPVWKSSRIPEVHDIAVVIRNLVLIASEKEAHKPQADANEAKMRQRLWDDWQEAEKKLSKARSKIIQLGEIDGGNPARRARFLKKFKRSEFRKAEAANKMIEKVLRSAQLSSDRLSKNLENLKTRLNKSYAPNRIKSLPDVRPLRIAAARKDGR